MDAISETSAKAEARVGRVLRGKWQLVSVLGVGGMGAVYEARHRNGARAAIKMLHDRFSVDGNVGRRFRKEAYLANAVEHPGVVVINDDDVDEHGTPFLVMDLVRGETVEGMRVAAGGRLGVELVRTIAVALLDVLQAAHDKGVTHRDIKPSNLLLTETGEVKVFDFGVATCTWPRASDSALSQAGTVLGTPAFMAPEQARSRWSDVDARTDIWAVGATMFKLLSGREVHEAETSNEVLGLAMTVPAPSLRDVVPESPAWLSAIVDRALSYERADRFQSARDMREALLAETIGPAAGRARESSRRGLPSSPPLRAWAFAKSGATATGETPMVPAEMTTARAKRVTLALAALAVVTIVGAAFVNGLGRGASARPAAPQGLAPSVVGEPSASAAARPSAPAPSAAASAIPNDTAQPAEKSSTASPLPKRKNGSVVVRTPATARSPEPPAPAANAPDPLDQRL